MGGVKIIRPAGELEWLAERNLYVTGSDAPVIAGVGYEDAYTRWARKTGKLQETGDKLRFRVGHALEPLIHSELEERRGLFLHDPGDYTIFVGANGWQTATLDRIIVNESGSHLDLLLADDLEVAIGIAQFKSVIEYMKGPWAEGPDEYTWIQVLHEMAVLGVEWGVAAALLGMGDWADFDIYHDQESADALLEAEYKFFKHIQEDTPPPVGGESSRAAINAMFPESRGATVFLPPEGGWVVKAVAWGELKQRQKDGKKALETATDALMVIENELKQALGEGERLEIGGVDGAFTWKQTPETRIEAYTRRAYRTWRKVKK